MKRTLEAYEALLDKKDGDLHFCRETMREAANAIYQAATIIHNSSNIIAKGMKCYEKELLDATVKKCNDLSDKLRWVESPVVWKYDPNKDRS